jgi:hypothetical protein
MAYIDAKGEKREQAPVHIQLYRFIMLIIKFISDFFLSIFMPESLQTGSKSSASGSGDGRGGGGPSNQTNNIHGLVNRKEINHKTCATCS